MFNAMTTNAAVVSVDQTTTDRRSVGSGFSWYLMMSCGVASNHAGSEQSLPRYSGCLFSTDRSS